MLIRSADYHAVMPLLFSHLFGVTVTWAIMGIVGQWWWWCGWWCRWRYSDDDDDDGTEYLGKKPNLHEGGNKRFRECDRGGKAQPGIGDFDINIINIIIIKRLSQIVRLRIEMKLCDLKMKIKIISITIWLPMLFVRNHHGHHHDYDYHYDHHFYDHDDDHHHLAASTSALCWKSSPALGTAFPAIDHNGLIMIIMEW